MEDFLFVSKPNLIDGRLLAMPQNKQSVWFCNSSLFSLAL